MTTQKSKGALKRELAEKDERIAELEGENAVAEALLWHSVHVDEWVDIVEECQKAQARTDEKDERIAGLEVLAEARRKVIADRDRTAFPRLQETRDLQARIDELHGINMRLERAYIKKCKEVECSDKRIVELEDENAVAEALLWHSVHVDEWVDIVEEYQKAQARIDAVEKWANRPKVDTDNWFKGYHWALHEARKILTADEPQGKDNTP